MPQHELDDLRDRTRSPNETTPTGWLRGTELTYLQELTELLRTGYDWTAAQVDLNRFDHYLAEVQGLDIHFFTSAPADRAPCRSFCCAAGPTRSTGTST